MIMSHEAATQLISATGIQFHAGLSIAGVGTIASLAMIYGGGGTVHNLSLGGYSYLVPPFEVANVFIGNYTSIAPGFIVAMGHPANLLTASPVAWRPWMANCDFPGRTTFEYLSTKIGSDVWIGVNVIVKAGVTIGDGCFIGAGSIVTKDIPPYSVAAGNPCRVLRHRFPPDVVERIQRLRWFDFDWRDQQIDWREPVASLDSMEAALQEGFMRRFECFIYEADGETMNLQKVSE